MTDRRWLPAKLKDERMPWRPGMAVKGLTLAAALCLAGCPSIQVVVPPTPGGKSAAPTGTKASASPDGKDAKGDKAPPPPAGTAGGCGDLDPGKDILVGDARHGAFAGKRLPAAFVKLASESAIKAKIAALADDKEAFACFQKNFPAAFVAHTGGVPATAPPPTVMPGDYTPPPDTAAACTRDNPAAAPELGLSIHGAYQNQNLPAGYTQAFASEAEITAAIAKEEGGANWACFQKFFPGATTVYFSRSGGAAGAPCEATAPAAAPTRGTAAHGRYNGQTLPAGWDNLPDEARVSEAILMEEGGPGWACFQKFYPGAVVVFETSRNDGPVTATPSPRPTTPPGGAASCTRPAPATTPDRGTAAQGGYNGQSLPSGWTAAFQTEADVTAMIRKIDGGPDWACFQKFYPGATTVYMTKK